jgi:hypothetical protein
MIPRLFSFLFVLAVIATSAAQSTPANGSNAPGNTPTPKIKTPKIEAVLDGPREAIFITPDQSCAGNDIPDAMARAFRDYTGTVHFITASSDLFQSLGPTLETVQHSCEPAYRSPDDGNPAGFNDQEWIDSFYTFDGRTIAGLTHTEYHGWSFPHECHTENYVECEYDSDTYHQSNDGGYHFREFQAPANLVAEVPYQYEVDHGPMGNSVDSNIVPWNGWYYAIATAWSWPPNCSGSTGPNRCITSGGAPLRTQDVFDPSSWRAWDGNAFDMTFVDPYLGPVENPQDHVFFPVEYMGYVNGLNIYQPANIAVATLWDYWDNALGTPGMYLTTSTDFIHWTTPTLVVTLNQILALDPPGSWLYAYFSLIDPNAPDLSFSMIGDHPYLYYVRLDNNDTEKRVLWRQKITLTATE